MLFTVPFTIFRIPFTTCKNNKYSSTVVVVSRVRVVRVRARVR